MFKKIFQWGVICVIVLLVLLQAFPYDRNHYNPAVLKEPPWDSAQTRELAKRACFDCHSNETAWPWYSNVAPVSWLVQQDVDKGRRQLNFSEWDRPQNETGELVPQLQQGKMPLWFYLPLHPSATLTADEKQQLLRGFQAIVDAQEQLQNYNGGEADSTGGIKDDED